MNSPATDLIRRRFSCRRHPERAIQDDMDFRLGGAELHGLSQRHAEAFVAHAVFNRRDGRFEDV